jgi:hypothetical protein
MGTQGLQFKRATHGARRQSVYRVVCVGGKRNEGIKDWMEKRAPEEAVTGAAAGAELHTGCKHLAHSRFLSSHSCMLLVPFYKVGNLHFRVDLPRVTHLARTKTESICL